MMLLLHCLLIAAWEWPIQAESCDKQIYIYTFIIVALVLKLIVSFCVCVYWVLALTVKINSCQICHLLFWQPFVGIQLA